MKNKLPQRDYGTCKRNVQLLIGCKSCVTVCPMDVFRFDNKANKSVIAYPENCQSCGQCFVNCLGRALTIVNDMYGYAQTSYRAATTVPMNRTAQKVIDRT